MTPDELVEKVARAIYEAARTLKTDLPEWRDTERYQGRASGVTLRWAAEFEARAAIRAVYEAMREPSEVIKTAGSIYTPSSNLHETGKRMAEASWRAQWAASPLAEVARDE